MPKADDISAAVRAATLQAQEVGALAAKRRAEFINNLLALDFDGMRRQVQVCVEVVEEAEASTDDREHAVRILDFVQALGRFRFPTRWPD